MGGVFSRFDVIADDFTSFGRKAVSLSTVFGSKDTWSEFLQDVGDYVIGTVLDQFESEGNSKGEAWKPLSDSRMNQRNANGLNPSGPMLVGETGTLLDSWKWDWLDGMSIIIGMHMDGGPNSPGYGEFNQLGVDRRNLPSRPMLIVDEDTISWINQRFEEAFEDKAVAFFGDY
jgi:hypothetical protein